MPRPLRGVPFPIRLATAVALAAALGGCGTSSPDTGQLELKEIDPEAIGLAPALDSAYPPGDWTQGGPVSRAAQESR